MGPIEIAKRSSPSKLGSLEIKPNKSYQQVDYVIFRRELFSDLMQ